MMSIKEKDLNRTENGKILVCEDLCLGYPIRKAWKEVVHQVSFSIDAGKTFALVGESGSGKSTIAKSLVKLIPVRGGRILFDGQEIGHLSASQFQPFRKKIQLVFQDPWHALNPRLSVHQLLSEPLDIHFKLAGRQLLERVKALLDSVHLSQDLLDRYPSELSGGQRQRVLLARSLAVEPSLLVCDEPVSALDVSIQAQLLDLLREIRDQRNLTLLFISHDLAVVQNLADHVLVLKNGTAVECQSCNNLFRNPQHDYTRMLIDACPQW